MTLVRGHIVVEGFLNNHQALGRDFSVVVEGDITAEIEFLPAIAQGVPFLAIADIAHGSISEVSISLRWFHAQSAFALDDRHSVAILEAPRVILHMSRANDVIGFVLCPSRCSGTPVILGSGLPLLTLNQSDYFCRDGIFRFKLSQTALSKWATSMICSGASIPDGEISLTVAVGDKTFGSMNVPIGIDFLGKVEGHVAGRLFGWVVLKHAPGAIAPISIYLDGVKYADAWANRTHKNLEKAGLSKGVGGFSEPLRLSPTGHSSVKVLVYAAGKKMPLNNSPLIIDDLLTLRPSFDWGRIATDAARGRAVTIAVPIFDQVDTVRRCVQAIIENTSCASRLLLIDDANEDERIGKFISEINQIKNLSIILHLNRQGHGASCNEAFAWAGDDDVVLLSSDTMVGPRWLENLRLAAYSRLNTATATPLSDKAGSFFAFEQDEKAVWPEGLAFSDVARLVTTGALGHLPAVPMGDGFCLYVRRQAIEQVGEFDIASFPQGCGEENDFRMRASRAGFINILDDRTYVHHVRTTNSCALQDALKEKGQLILAQRYPEYEVAKKFAMIDERVLVARWRVRRAFATPPKKVCPRVLFIISTTIGGTPQTNRDLMAALSIEFEPWLLLCDRHNVTLFRVRANQVDEVVFSEALATPLTPFEHRSEHYDGVVYKILVCYAIELVHIRHMAWHGLGLFDACMVLNVPVILSFHDFYFICPTDKLIDNACQPCCLTDRWTDTPCEMELWPSESAPPLKPAFIHRWRELMGQCLQMVDAFVTTSAFARERLCHAYPQLRGADFRIIEHGRDFEEMLDLSRPPDPGEVMRVLVPGNISIAKGAAFIQEMVGFDKGCSVEFHILGDSEILVESKGLRLHGKYVRSEFQTYIKYIRPHIGAVFSRWPETYCHTLTEMWACGLPVLGSDIGAVGERLHEHGGGWLFDMNATPKDVLEYLRIIRGDSDEFNIQLEGVRRWQNGHGSGYGTAAMATYYSRLYHDLFARKLAFKNSLTFGHYQFPV